MTCRLFIACWPDGIKGPVRILDFQGYFTAIMPALLDVTGATCPQTMRGRAAGPLIVIMLRSCVCGSARKQSVALCAPCLKVCTLNGVQKCALYAAMVDGGSVGAKCGHNRIKQSV